MSEDIRADQLAEGGYFRQFGMDEVHHIEAMLWHGDTVLITCGDGCEITLDGDEVVDDYTFHPVAIKGTVTLANGAEYEFSINNVAGDIGWQQWGHIPAVLSNGVALMEGLVEKINEDDLLVVPHS